MAWRRRRRPSAAATITRPSAPTSARRSPPPLDPHLHAAAHPPPTPPCSHSPTVSCRRNRRRLCGWSCRRDRLRLPGWSCRRDRDRPPPPPPWVCAPVSSVCDSGQTGKARAHAPPPPLPPPSRRDAGPVGWRPCPTSAAQAATPSTAPFLRGENGTRLMRVTQGDHRRPSRANVETNHPYLTERKRNAGAGSRCNERGGNSISRACGR